MAKRVVRDLVWSAALEAAQEERVFKAGDVMERIESDITRRTVRDTLKTMSEMGWLSATPARYGVGEYRPGDRLD